MIPLKLSLKNFLSYGEPAHEINFEPYNLICFSGKNGHGKSALLDALTWALWGQARKLGGVSRADEALIRLGQQEMAVSCDFLCHDQRYTVRRELSYYYGKTKITLECGLFDTEKNIVVPLTEKSVRLTQEKIEKIIGLDFETFSSSVFLRQGQSNEFSKKSAQERKEILASILGLDQYERVRRYLMDALRVLQIERDNLISMHERLCLELEQMADVHNELHEIEAKNEQLQKKEKELAQKKENLQRTRNELFKQKEQLFILDKEINEIKEQIQYKKHQYELKFAEEAKEIELAYVDTQSQQKLLEERYKIHQERYKNCQKEEVELVQELQALEKETQERVKMEEKFQAAQLLFDKRKELYHKMIGYGNWVRQELYNIQNNDLVAVKSEERCPLCEQPLRGEKQSFLVDKLARRTQFYEHRVGRISSFITQSKETLVKEHETLGTLTKNLQKFAQNAERKKKLKPELQELQKEKKALEIVGNNIVQEQQRIIKEAETIKNKLQQCHRQVMQQLEQQVDYQQLQKLLQEKKIRRKNFDELQFEKREQRVHLDEKSLNDEMRTFEQQKSFLLQERGRLQQVTVQHKKLAEEQKNYEKKIAQKKSEIEEHRVMIAALGKDGIQALLIESVIPEIEYEANKLLASLSDQNAQIFIESLRDLKSGGTKETLDIKIADNAGIRPYELFSGGEAFRIDFALRIAISTLLARRAGTSLQTLIIDEGFSSQDEDGLQLIMDAIYKIQDRFAKVIIISHLPALKEQFPVHFMIEKTASGSQVTVIEQG